MNPDYEAVKARRPDKVSLMTCRRSLTRRTSSRRTRVRESTCMPKCSCGLSIRPRDSPRKPARMVESGEETEEALLELPCPLCKDAPLEAGQ